VRPARALDAFKEAGEEDVRAARDRVIAFGVDLFMA
jgi:hypothetical protein